MHRFYRFVLYFAEVNHLWLICDLYGAYIDHWDPQIASDVVMSSKAKKKKQKKPSILYCYILCHDTGQIACYHPCWVRVRPVPGVALGTNFCHEVNWLPAQERVSHIHLTATGSFLPGFTSPNTEASQNPHLIPFFISAGSCHNTVQYNSILCIPLNSGCHQWDEIRITNCTESGKSENFRSSQWRKFCQHDISFPALSGNRSRIYLLHIIRNPMRKIPVASCS